MELVGKPEIAAALSPSTLERLRQTLRQYEARQHEAQYKAQLDLVSASGQGDPSELCNKTYASMAACQRAATADTTAVRKQVFPAYSCGRIIPGKFITAKDEGEQEQRLADHPQVIIVPHRLTFEEALECHRERLRTETDLLEKLPQAR